jgi:hypothetical protein
MTRKPVEEMIKYEHTLCTVIAEPEGVSTLFLYRSAVNWAGSTVIADYGYCHLELPECVSLLILGG